MAIEADQRYEDPARGTEQGRGLRAETEKLKYPVVAQDSVAKHCEWGGMAGPVAEVIKDV